MRKPILGEMQCPRSHIRMVTASSNSQTLCRCAGPTHTLEKLPFKKAICSTLVNFARDVHFTGKGLSNKHGSSSQTHGPEFLRK